MNQSGVAMTAAASSFLNRPLRTESQARAAHEQAERERHRRLEHHGAAFCRKVLAGAFERVYQADGSYRLREIQSGNWLENLPATDLVPCQNLASPSTLPPAQHAPPVTAISKRAQKIIAARRFGYTAALRDLSSWISEAALSPRMDASTLNVLNDQIAKLSNRAKTGTSSEFDTLRRSFRDPA